MAVCSFCAPPFFLFSTKAMIATKDSIEPHSREQLPNSQRIYVEGTANPRAGRGCPRSGWLDICTREMLQRAEQRIVLVQEPVSLTTRDARNKGLALKLIKHVSSLMH